MLLSLLFRYLAFFLLSASIIISGCVIPRFDLFDTPQISHFPQTDLSTLIKHRSGYFCKENNVTPTAKLPNPFSILVWNIHKGEDTGWQLDLQNFARNRPLVLLQEATNLQQFEQHLPHLNQLHSFAFQYDTERSGVLSASTATSLRYCANLTNEPWIRIPKTNLVSYYQLSTGETLLVANLHLINFELNPEQYQQQLTALSQLLNEHQGALIVAGDFNAWNKRRKEIIERFAQQHYLQEVIFSPDQRTRFLNSPLDYLFIRGLNIAQPEVPKTIASDHNPLLAELSL